jgi:LmbE family N-acetylglucosaminyl deacetylase
MPRRFAAAVRSARSTLLALLLLNCSAARGDAAGSAAQLSSRVPARPHLEVPDAPHSPVLAPNDLSTALLAAHDLAVPPRLRLLVFAPHPDDETIAVGGLIQRVRENGGEVLVAFVTNGDGYVDAVRHAVRRSETSSSDFIAYGQRRHDEAEMALTRLGLSTDSAVFLGFPDDGIDDLWAGHWSEQHPYTSPYTRFDRPPYKESLRRDIEYAGADLKSEITRVLREFQPDWVVVPEPRDRHPDHCTTGVFVLDALHCWHDAERRHPRVLAYLVHYPDYPASTGWTKLIGDAGVGGTSTASRALGEASWLRLSLSSSQQATKAAALGAYASQLDVMRPFLQQFLRSYELFTELDNVQIITIPREYAARFRHAP